MLFVAGAVLAYFVVAQGLSFLLQVGGDVQTTGAVRRRLLLFLIALLIIFGVSFELPLLVVMLNLVGVLTYARLKAWRRGLIFGLFVFAAIATPGQDPISMRRWRWRSLLLFELAIQIARVHDTPQGPAAAPRRAGTSWDPDQPTPDRHRAQRPRHRDPSPLGHHAEPDRPPPDPAHRLDDVT